MSSIESPRDNPESFIQKELIRLQLDRVVFLREIWVTEIELKNIIQRGDVQDMFRLNIESPEVPNLNALQNIMSGVLVGYQSTGNVPSSISEMSSRSLPGSTAPEVRLVHWKLRQIAKLWNTHPAFQKIDGYWKNMQKPSAQALAPRAPGETDQGYLERAKGFVKEHPVASSIVGIWWAALLYKIFWNSEKEWGGDGKDKWFFQSILEKIPSMGFFGTLVSLAGIWYFFGDKIRWVFDTGIKTVEVAGKVMDTVKAVAEAVAPSTPMPRRIELMKSLIEQVGDAAKWLISDAAKQYGIDLNQWSYQWPKKQSNEWEHTGNLEAIGLARASQFYYGTWKPWKELNTSEKAIMQWTVSGWVSGWFSRGDINHTEALGRVSWIESEMKTLEASIPTKTNENLTKLNTWNGSFDGKDWKEALKSEHIGKQVNIINSWALPVMFSLLDDASKKLIAEHFAKQEIDILIQAQRTLIDAIKAWPAEYGKFLASKWDTTLLYERMKILEAKKAGLNLENLHKITPDDWKNFSRLAEEHLSLIREKDVILGSKRDRMLEIQKEIAGDPTKKTLLETEFQKLANEYAQVENDVMKSTNEMFTKEKSMVRVLENAGLSHSSWNPLHHFMVGKGWIAQWHHAETLGDLRMVSPGKSGLLRMGFSGWNFVLMGVGVGAVLYINGGMNEWAKHDLTRMAWGLVPVIGWSMDVHDAWKDFKGWNIMHGIANLGAATASFTGDALLALSLLPAGTTAPLGVGAKWAMYGLRNFIKWLWVEWAQSVAIKETLPESWKIILSVTDTSGKIVEKTVDLTLEWKNAWKWIQERMAPQRENIAKYAKMGLVGGIGAMLIAGPGYMLASYAFNKEWGAQKIA